MARAAGVAAARADTKLGSHDREVSVVGRKTSSGEWVESGLSKGVLTELHSLVEIKSESQRFSVAILSPPRDHCLLGSLNY
jgi:hypothetical protein